MNTFNDLFTTEDTYWSSMDHGPKYEIAFLISDQHMISTGGIGQFAKYFYETCLDLHVRVHFILDKMPSKDFHKVFDKAVFHYPDNPIPYTIHQNEYVFNDTLNMYKQANFHTALVQAKKSLQKDYDLYICNTNESILPAYSAGCTPLVIYTHLYKHIHKTSHPGKFSHYFHNIVDTLSNLPNVHLATQSQYNKELLEQHHKNVFVLPIGVPDTNFLDQYDRTNTNGVLFVGRHEDGKRPEKFLEFCAKAQVPVKIMTSPKSAIKFTEKCEKLCLAHDVRHSLIGQEKLDFMLSSSILLNVSKHESLSMATLECIGHMPVLTLDDQPWTNYFDQRYLITCNKKNIVQQVKQYHDRPWTNEFFPKNWYQNGSLDYLNNLEHQARDDFEYMLDRLCR